MYVFEYESNVHKVLPGFYDYILQQLQQRYNNKDFTADTATTSAVTRNHVTVEDTDRAAPSPPPPPPAATTTTKVTTGSTAPAATTVTVDEKKVTSTTNTNRNKSSKSNKGSKHIGHNKGNDNHHHRILVEEKTTDTKNTKKKRSIFILRKDIVQKQLSPRMPCGHGCAGPVMEVVGRLFLSWLTDVVEFERGLTT